MTNALPWGVVVPYCLFSMFVFYQELHARDFRGASYVFHMVLLTMGFLGFITGAIFLVYYGIKVVWWAIETCFDWLRTVDQTASFLLG